jgi:hypothetical protein
MALALASGLAKIRSDSSSIQVRVEARNVVRSVVDTTQTNVAALLPRAVPQPGLSLEA